MHSQFNPSRGISRLPVPSIRVPARLGFIALAACALLANPAARSQSDAGFPNKAIRIVVPLASGGPTDAAARALGRALAVKLGTEVIVDNKPGANGAVGAANVLGATADGYTLLFAPLSMAGLPSTMKKPPFASIADMAVVGTVPGNIMCVFAHPSLPVGSFKSLVDYARANPGKLSYGSSSLGEYLVMTHVVSATGADMVRVPYKGSAQMMPDFLEGRINLAAIPARAGAAHVQAGKLKAIGCASNQRIDALPGVPTLAEGGLSGVPSAAGHLVVAPPKTPSAVVERIATAVARAFEDPALRNEMAQLQLYGEVLGSVPSIALIRDTEKSWQQFVRDAAIELE
jgi:tripartite-type tricarboxylate transporter receptor subunit TctC